MIAGRRWVVGLLILLWWWAGAVGMVTAATLSATASAEITASVPEIIATPPTPVLVAPANGAMLNSGVVTFVWQIPNASNTSIHHFELSLNGQRKFGNIHSYAESNSEYQLSVNGDEYTLRLTNDHWLDDGEYTWKVRVINDNDIGTDSTTWSFTIDSQPPPLLIVEIDGQTVGVSATDISSIPATPFTVRHNDPEIKGKTQSWSEVQMLVVYSDGHSEQYRTFASEYGDFHFFLDDLPERQIVLLTFTAIDPYTNMTVLSGLPVQFVPLVWRVVLPIPWPEPLVWEIYYTIPRWPLARVRPTTMPTPIVIAFPSASPLPVDMPITTHPVTKVVELPLFAWQPWLLIWLFAIGNYVLGLFWLSGNYWRYLGGFVWTLIRWWLLGSGRPPHYLCKWWQQTPVPLVRGEIWWLDARRRQRRRAIWSNPSGRWGFPFRHDIVYSWRLYHPRWVYPVDWESASKADDNAFGCRQWCGVASEPDSDNPHYYLNGESVTYYLPTQKKSSTANCLVLEEGSVHYLAVWLDLRKPRHVINWWWPRLGLWVALAISIIMLAGSRELWGLLLLFFSLLLIWRDWQWQLPAQWRQVYEEK